MLKGADSAAAMLGGFLDAELARFDLPPERLALVGFSQGTMMSLHVGLARAVKPAAIVGYSGMLPGADGLGPLGRDAPPILLVHGDADPVIPVEATLAAAAALGRAGVCVQWHISGGVGHGIDPQGLSLGGTFLAMALRGLLRGTGPASSVLPG
jgi:phospholipase/carboxylesterase